MKTYLQYMGGSIEDFKNTFMPQAESQVKIRLALEKIVELEKLEATVEDLNAEYEKMAKDYGMEVDKVKAAIPVADLGKDLAVSKAMELVKANAVIIEVDKKTEKDPAKKPAAKKSASTKKAEGEAEKKPAAKKTSASATTKKTTSTAKKSDSTAEKKPAAKKTTAASTAKKTTSTSKKSESAAKKPAAKKTTTTKKTTVKKDAE